MRVYPKYKSAGIEWIEEIPEHWGVKKIKFLTREHKQGYYTEKEYVNEGVKLVRITDINDNAFISFHDMPFVMVSQADEQLFGVVENDFLFARSGTIGRFGVVKNPERAVFASYLIRFRFEGIDLDFLKHSFFSTHFREALISTFHGGANKNVHAENIKEQWIPVPPSAEQIAIATYLDDKTAKIDTLIDKKQRLIELLKEQRTAIINRAITKGINPNVKMKDSGIEWIGEIPEHWELKRLKHVVKGGLVNGIFKKREEFGVGTRIINVINVYKEDCAIKESELERVNTTDNELQAYRVVVGDIFFVRSSLKREGIAAAACAEAISEPLVFECHLIKVSPDPTAVDFHFLINYVSCSPVRNRLLALSNTTTMTTIAQPSLSALEVLVPPLKEQRLIWEDIDRLSGATQKTISRTEKEIQLLQEYRTALISEVVTGKIDVRDNHSGKSN